MAAERALGSSSSGSLQVRRQRLTGELDVASAHRALELLSQNSLYGSLVVSDGLSDLCFFFTRGGLRVLASGRDLPTLRARLVLRGALRAEDARRVERELQASARGDKDVEERQVLIESAGVAPGAVDDAAREVIAEALLGCLFWESPQYEAVTGEPNAEIMQRRDLPAVTLSLGVGDLVEKIKGKIRTISEVRRTVSSLRVTVEPTPRGREAVESHQRLGDGPAGERRTRLMRKVVAEPGVRAVDLGEHLGCGELELASLLHELTVEGYLRIERPPPNKKEELERIREMEEAVDQALSQLLRRVRLAHDAAGVGEKDRAARHLARAGGLLLTEGRDDEAVRSFASALEHAPEDLEAREGYVQGLWNTRRTTEALEQSEALGQRYLDLNLPGRAKRILERAVGQEERTSSLDLLVRSLVKLRQSKAAVEAGERLVNRLRREGRKEEAREAAARLLQIADARDRQRLLRAAGIDARRALALVVVLLLSLVSVPPAMAYRSSRAEYAEVARQAGELRRIRDPLAFGERLGVLRVKFERLAQGSGEVGERASAVVTTIERLERDHQRYVSDVAPELPWTESSDVTALVQRLTGVRRQAGPALAEPLGRIVKQIETFVSDADREQRELVAMSASDAAFEKARQMRTRYAAYPRVLEESVVKVEVVTDPPEAQVVWGGLEYAARTPLELAVPLRGSKELVLALEGHRTVTRSIAFEDLEGPRYLVGLEAVAEPVGEPDLLADLPEPDPEPEARDPDPEPEPDPDLVSPVDDTPAAEPHDPPPRIETRDREFRGDASRPVSIQEDPKHFAGLRLNPALRAVVEVDNELRGIRMYLVGVRIHLVTRTRRGQWVRQPPVYVELGRFRRWCLVDPDTGVLNVGPLGETHDVGRSWLMDEVQEGLDQAVREYRTRRGYRR